MQNRGNRQKKSQRGVGLVESLAAIAITGTLIYVSMDMSVNMSETKGKLIRREAHNQIVSSIKDQLSTSDGCNQAIGGLRIRSTGGGVSFSRGKGRKNGHLGDTPWAAVQQETGDQIAMRVPSLGGIYIGTVDGDFSGAAGNGVITSRWELNEWSLNVVSLSLSNVTQGTGSPADPNLYYGLLQMQLQDQLDSTEFREVILGAINFRRAGDRIQSCQSISDSDPAEFCSAMAGCTFNATAQRCECVPTNLGCENPGEFPIRIYGIVECGQLGGTCPAGQALTGVGLGVAGRAYCSPIPYPCPIPVAWTWGGGNCSVVPSTGGSFPTQYPHGYKAIIADRDSLYQGNASFTCNYGTFSEDPGATCAAVQCPAQTFNWVGSVAGCTQSVPATNATNTAITITDSIGPALGSAQVTCQSAGGGTWSNISGSSCGSQCPAQTIQWTVGPDTCEATTVATAGPAGPFALTNVTAGLTGNASVTCQANGSWTLPTGTTCSSSGSTSNCTEGPGFVYTWSGVRADGSPATCTVPGTGATITNGNTVNKAYANGTISGNAVFTCTGPGNIVLTSGTCEDSGCYYETVMGGFGGATTGGFEGVADLSGTWICP